MRVHLFSLGKRHDVCERCGVHFGTKSGNECAGEDLTPREAALVAAAKDHGYAEGIRDASQSVRALYDIASNNGGRGCSPLELYRKLQDLGDLVDEVREIVDVPIEAKIWICDLCNARAVCAIQRAERPYPDGGRLPPGVLECQGWLHPENWKEIALPGFPRRLFCSDCAPVVAMRLEAALTILVSGRK